MIKNVLLQGAVNDYVYINKRYSGSSMHGQEDTILVRWNRQRECLEGYINNSWQDVGFEQELVFTDKFRLTLEWCRDKMAEEQELIKVINKYPEIKKLKEQLDLMVHLVKEHENEPNS